MNTQGVNFQPSKRGHGPTHHAERGASHAPTVVKPDEAVIVIFSDALLPWINSRWRGSTARCRIIVRSGQGAFDSSGELSGVVGGAQAP